MTANATYCCHGNDGCLAMDIETVPVRIFDLCKPVHVYTAVDFMKTGRCVASKPLLSLLAAQVFVNHRGPRTQLSQ